ncbi:hypothetical protein NDU88_010508 [Pleurodeles waltl]|uniref:Uncharacterized protein n=1 Tax=Pleurodeles waltl TaxID=8319 RepID=A0AAV7PVS9_PLEWA|nr:hypothetical protein NDU88_010508 [Pleurodeles waltl]
MDTCAASSARRHLIRASSAQKGLRPGIIQEGREGRPLHCSDTLPLGRGWVRPRWEESIWTTTSELALRSLQQCELTASRGRQAGTRLRRSAELQPGLGDPVSLGLFIYIRAAVSDSTLFLLTPCHICTTGGTLKEQHWGSKDWETTPTGIHLGPRASSAKTTLQTLALLTKHSLGRACNPRPTQSASAPCRGHKALYTCTYRAALIYGAFGICKSLSCGKRFGEPES